MTYEPSIVLEAVVNSSWNSSDKIYHYAKVIATLVAGDMLDQIDKDLQKSDASRFMRGIPVLRSVISEAMKEEAGVTIAEQLVEDLRTGGYVYYPFRDNFEQLLKTNLVHLFSAFCNNFRGEITHIHAIGGHNIIQTMKEGKKNFYFIEHDTTRLCSHYADNLDHALLMSIAHKYKDLDAAHYAARVLNLPLSSAEE